MWKKVKRLIQIGFVGLMLAILFVIISGVQERDDAVDYAIVLGNKVELDGRPSPRLAARLDRAYYLWQQKRCGKIIVSGGTGVEGFDESRVMHDYLLSKGVPVSALIMDPNGNTTSLTAENAAKIIPQAETISVCAVSQFFHTTRCRLALKKKGFTEVTSSYARYFEPRDVYATMREIPALIKYAFFD